MIPSLDQQAGILNAPVPFSSPLVSNIEFKEWTDYLGDAPLTMALIDRIVDGAIIQKFEGKSYRVHRAEQQKRRQQQGAASASRRENDES